MYTDFDRCYRAVQSKDTRFDGWFVTAVLTTAIYCRPSCPVRPPYARNMRFYPTAAAAQRAGFRACKRCRPDASPGSPEWNVRGDVVARAMRLIADGLVDRAGVSGLAAAVGYSERQLNRLLIAEVGAGPLAIARAQRAQTARVLIENTELPMADITFAAGFASVRQFNDTVREVYDRPPSALRRRPARGRGTGVRPPRITLKLPVRRPYAAEPIFDFLTTRAVAGVEAGWTDNRRLHYRRSCALPHGAGVFELIMEPTSAALTAVLELDDLRDLAAAVSRIRRLLDLDADPEAVDGTLGADPALAGIVADRPGVRVPGVVDGHEIAFRTLIGQQILVAGAATSTAAIVARHGRRLAGDHDDQRDSERQPTHLFPTATELAEADPETLPMPRARGRSLVGLAAALADGRVDLSPGADRAEARAKLLELPGIGPWTAGYIAMRGLGDPDVLLAEDLVIRRELQRRGLGPTGRPGWAPWRSYATMRLWQSSATELAA